MKREEVLRRLDGTGIRREEETVTPIAGENVPLPYFIVRTEEADDWDDMGRTCVKTIDWTVTLFTANKDFALECKIRTALALMGTVEITRYPDGEPYQVNFAFATKGV